MFTPSFFLFSCLSNFELADYFSCVPSNNINIDLDLKKILTDTLTDEIIDNFEFKYYTPCQLSDLANKYRSSTMLSVFHVNVRSLNADYNKLVTFLQSLSFHFDITSF